jgi:hypothetical protein
MVTHLCGCVLPCLAHVPLATNVCQADPPQLSSGHVPQTENRQCKRYCATARSGMHCHPENSEGIIMSEGCEGIQDAWGL